MLIRQRALSVEGLLTVKKFNNKYISKVCEVEANIIQLC